MSLEIMDKMRKRADLCVKLVNESENVHIISHNDADGITSAAIAKTALGRRGIEHDVSFVRQIDEATIKSLCSDKSKLYLFTDLGSTVADYIVDSGIDAVICDHHVLSGRSENIEEKSKTLPGHLNPHIFGANGSYEISGSGTTYLLARALEEIPGQNKDLAAIAIVGAIGDMQNRKYRKLVSMNRIILEEGVEEGVLSYALDLSLFGKQTRPVYKILQYTSDPYIPGLTGNEEGCINFLQKLSVGYSRNDGAKLWIELSDEEKQKIVSGLMGYCLNLNFKTHKLESLVQECYTLVNEKPGSELRDASEYATLLNSTGRYDKAEIGMAVCIGNREEALKHARTLLSEHRKNLVNGLNFVKDSGITQMENIQYFYSGTEIKDTIVGIIASMSSSLEGTDRKKPIIGLANSEDGIKVSARGTQELIRRGLNLSTAMSEVSDIVGGTGGGHDIAAGATIPEDSLQTFLALLDEYIGEQMSA